MTLIEAAKLALEHGEFPQGSGIIHELRQAIAQAEQHKPVVHVGDLNEYTAGYLQHEGLSLDDPLYAFPPKHEWQGLTDEEIDMLLLLYGLMDQWPTQKQVHAFTHAIEAKLKEKNNIS